MSISKSNALDRLRRQVCDANRALAARAAGLVVGTFGNVSGIDRRLGLAAIKPSGVPYDRLTPSRIVVVSLATGEAVAGKLRPSSDLPTHLELYRAWPTIGGVAHTHSLHATAWAQAGRAIPPLGTTHADFFHGPVPCTRPLRPAEIRNDYERNTGLVIVECLGGHPAGIGVLVASHGPFTWGRSPADAVEAAIMLEHVAALATLTLRVRPGVPTPPSVLLDKHFSRKHGPDAYYGQRERP